MAGIDQLLEQCGETTIHEHRFREPQPGKVYSAALLTYSQPANGGFLYQIKGKKETAAKIISIIKEAAGHGSGTGS